ncbi:hypothetical protein AAFF_G00290500 [Aldrovandia affinis]|uniref:Uncharacterized protein n=1 Tax=Aldrovandia affinis TaxID=143900 RepID=A0AAD7W1N4_9TELE|nr:hypothetical protein AAFF_G00290500 [Aldrovandia affinis]
MRKLCLSPLQSCASLEQSPGLDRHAHHQHRHTRHGGENEQRENKKRRGQSGRRRVQASWPRVKDRRTARNSVSVARPGSMAATG